MLQLVMQELLFEGVRPVRRDISVIRAAGLPVILIIRIKLGCQIAELRDAPRSTGTLITQSRVASPKGDAHRGTVRLATEGGARGGGDSGTAEQLGQPQVLCQQPEILILQARYRGLHYEVVGKHEHHRHRVVLSCSLLCSGPRWRKEELREAAAVGIGALTGLSAPMDPPEVSRLRSLLMIDSCSCSRIFSN